MEYSEQYILFLQNLDKKFNLSSFSTFILEGVERSGKSTLATVLCRFYEERGEKIFVFKDPFTSFIFSGLWSPMFIRGYMLSKYLSVSFFTILNGLRPVVFDRWLFSEYVYGKCIRKYDKEYLDFLECLIKFVLDKILPPKILLVVSSVSYKLFLRRERSRNERFYSEEEFVLLRNEFDSLFLRVGEYFDVLSTLDKVSVGKNEFYYLIIDRKEGGVK